MVDRLEKLRTTISKADKGIEIGPWCNPIASKSQGYNCSVLDVFSTAQLKENARKDSGIPTELAEGIEEVDFVGSSADIAELVDARGELGTFGYIISSHNFEHIPDPIKFFQGCQKVLSPGGALIMAIPDKRGCFDYFRPNTSLAEMLQAHAEGRTRPTPTQVFERLSMHAHLTRDGLDMIGFSLSEDPRFVAPYETLEEAFSIWRRANNPENNTYLDTHCWTFTPASFQLIYFDLQFLGFLNMEISSIDTGENEFFVVLKNRIPDLPKPSRAQFYERRAALMHRMLNESAEASRAFRLLKELHEHVGVTSNLPTRDSHLQKDLLLLQTQLRNAHKRLEQIENSRSWRLTSFLRLTASRLRKLTGQTH